MERIRQTLAGLDPQRERPAGESSDDCGVQVLYISAGESGVKKV